jgi:hypothetical protein
MHSSRRLAAVLAVCLGLSACTTAPTASPPAASTPPSTSPPATNPPAGTPAPVSRWTVTGSMAEARVEDSLTTLADGRALAAGGFGDGLANHLRRSAELYDPSTGSWTKTGDLLGGRAGHTATLLSDGTVLVAGGSTSPTERLATAEIYDPTTGSWSATGAMHAARAGQTATLLPDGRVLIAGGEGPNGALGTSEIYDPAKHTWRAAAHLTEARSGGVAVVLKNGRVLVVGGAIGTAPLASAELFDPSTGKWNATKPMAQTRIGHAVALLPDSRVLVAGGLDGGLAGNLQPSNILASAELFDPTTSTWSSTGPMADGRFQFTLTTLADGTAIAVAGDRIGDGPQAHAEIYDPASGTWTPTDDIPQGCAAQRAVLLADGTLLVAGGEGRDARGLASADVFRGPPVVVATLADNGTMFPGTYRTKFDPPMTITINDLVDLDCAPGYRCRGDIDVNLPQWVGFEFGNVHGSELDITRLDQVFADDGTTPVEPPADLASWLVSRQGIKTLSGPTPVSIGGIAGTQLDLQADRVVPYGPNGLTDPPAFGVGPALPFRVIVLKVGGHWVMISEVFGPEASVYDFDAMVDGLQPVIESIRWE